MRPQHEATREEMNATGADDVASAPRSVLGAIRAIRSGELHASALDGATRRRCVEHLTAEGCTTAEIAEILSISERTVMRDRRAIRETNAVDPAPGFIGETVGQLMHAAEGAIGRLRRLSREKGAPLSARVDAERSAWNIHRDLVVLLQRLGYLPTATMRERGDPARFDVEPPTLEELEEELRRLESIHAENKPLLDELEEVRMTVQRIDAGRRVKQLMEGGGAAHAENERNDTLNTQRMEAHDAER